MSTLPRGHEPIKGGYYGYTSPGSVRLTGHGSGTPDVTTAFIGFRVFRRAREPRRAPVGYER